MSQKREGPPSPPKDPFQPSPPKRRRVEGEEGDEDEIEEMVVSPRGQAPESPQGQLSPMQVGEVVEESGQGELEVAEEAGQESEPGDVEVLEEAGLEAASGELQGLDEAGQAPEQGEMLLSVEVGEQAEQQGVIEPGEAGLLPPLARVFPRSRRSRESRRHRRQRVVPRPGTSSAPDATAQAQGDESAQGSGAPPPVQENPISDSSSTDDEESMEWKPIRMEG